MSESSIVIMLQSRGIRASHQRLAIMEYLFSTKSHPTADEVFLALSPKMPTLSKATVYNTLNLLSSCDAIKTITIDPSEKRFDAFMHPHAHFICEGCSVVLDVELTQEQQEAIKSVSPNMKILQRELYIKGLCSKCAKSH